VGAKPLQGIVDPEKVSSELDDAAYDYYRRSIREAVAGYPDEVTEDASWRKLTEPQLATAGAVAWAHERERMAAAAAELAEGSAMSPAMVALEATGAALGAAEPGAMLASSSAQQGGGVEQVAELPSAARRVAAAGASGAAGLVLGVGAVRLVGLLLRLRRRRGVARAPAGAAVQGKGSKGGRKAGTGTGKKRSTQPRT
jgi:hypothetical protein